MQDYWQRQEESEPLFPDILWSMPETNVQRKKLVLVGGNTHSFMGVARSYELVNQAGVGECKVVLPKKLERLVGASLPEAVYLENNASGGITKDSVSSMLEYERWGDGVLLAGELGHSSETSLFVNEYVAKSKKPLVLSGDTLDSFYENPASIFGREETVVVADFKQLQRFAPKLGITTPLTSDMGLVKLVEALHEITENREALIVTQHQASLTVAMYGEVASTHYKPDSNWQLEVAAKAAVFYLQHAGKPFQAVTSSVYQQTS